MPTRSAAQLQARRPRRTGAPPTRTASICRSAWVPECSPAGDFRVVFLGLSAKLGPRTPLDRRGSPCNSICMQHQHRRPIIRSVCDEQKLPTDCLQVPSLPHHMEHRRLQRAGMLANELQRHDVSAKRNDNDLLVCPVRRRRISQGKAVLFHCNEDNLPLRPEPLRQSFKTPLTLSPPPRTFGLTWPGLNGGSQMAGGPARSEDNVVAPKNSGQRPCHLNPETRGGGLNVKDILNDRHP